MPVAVVGSGSNLLIADEGVSGLVLKLEGELARIERAGERGLVCGGGARLPAVAAHAARAGLSGIEFAVNIPGTVGGAVRMNANAYGGELARTLEWVEVAGARGIDRRRPPDLGFAYRSSNLAAGEVVARASFALLPAPPAQVKATLAELRARRHEAQPQGIKTFGSTFKNPEGEGPMREGRTAGLLLCRGRLQRPHRRRRALRAQARQLHREHRRGHHRGDRRADGRGPPSRAGALRRGAGARGADARAGALPVEVGVRGPRSKTPGWIAPSLPALLSAASPAPCRSRSRVGRSRGGSVWPSPP